jgi:hypothetical protein
MEPNLDVDSIARMTPEQAHRAGLIVGTIFGLALATVIAVEAFERHERRRIARETLANEMAAQNRRINELTRKIADAERTNPAQKPAPTSL